jgi:acyl-CoA synthetase (AMP-forming)/AMP-acid ligase II/acyl carrier protein
MSFDIFGLELFLPLITSARVIIAEQDDTLDGFRLAELLKDFDVSVMQATPSTWRLLIESGWSGHDDLKVICGGEAFPSDLVGPLLDRCGELWNLYGPTETTIWSTAYRVKSKEDPMLIGLPIANTQTYILDSSLQPVPLGVVGELYIGGDGLSHGYLNRPELTAENFIPHPFSEDAGARIYITGDLARYRPDGKIECLGRIDQQVKLRGFRIELGEIEARIKEVDAVNNCVVVLREDRPADTRLVAYYVVRDEQAVEVSDIRRPLQAKLPDYMVPQHFMELAAIPLTPNGKVDRKALPKPEAAGALEQGYVAPRTPIEAGIAEIWQSVLKLDRVGIHDNFFDLGGHSLLATRVVSRVRQEFHVDLRLMDFFKMPTIAGLAKGLEGLLWINAGRPSEDEAELQEREEGIV